MASRRQNPIYGLRKHFVDYYCACRGWDRDNLRIDQIDEIRANPEWQAPESVERCAFCERPYVRGEFAARPHGVCSECWPSVSQIEREARERERIMKNN